MWSGPRNISTALMRSFGSRNDCQPVDEPFYAYYLNETGLQHPMREEVLASQSKNWRGIVKELNSPRQDEKPLLYLKHMTQHMLADIDLSNFTTHVNCFLIRDPRLVIASFSEKWDQIDAAATGFPQQLELFRYFETHAETPCIVIEGEDILKNPSAMLKALCKKIGISFDTAMLQWKKGRKPEDGIWAAHWYNAVEASTQFAPYSTKDVCLTLEQEQLAATLDPIYRTLKNQKLTFTED